MFIDSHCHLDRLDLSKHQDSLSILLDDARARGVHKMLCVGIDMQLVIDSDAPDGAIRDLTETAKALCMAHQAVLSPTPSVFGVRLNGRVLEPTDG